MYDFFRDRVIFPITDPRGRVIAFGGRKLGEGEPKYLNSPETPAFDKGRTLYNYASAGPAAAEGRAVARAAVAAPRRSLRTSAAESGATARSKPASRDQLRRATFWARTATNSPSVT